MIHPFAFLSTGSGSGGGGGGAPAPTITFNPDGGAFSGNSVSVTITIANAAKLRWKIDSGAYTTVNGTSTTLSVTLTQAGKTLYCDAMNGSNVVLATKSSNYFLPGGGQ